MNDGDVVLLENVRFNPEETSKDEAERAAYAKKIAALGDVFVSDGFGVVHRAQGSNYDVAADLPAAAGLLVEKEVKALSKATENPERPFTVVLGGSKVSDKLGVIENLAAAGLLVEKEVKALSKATENPERPFTVVLGGSKVSDKLGVIENLLDKADRLVIGGGMVFTFLKAKGYEVGTSLLEEDQIDKVKGYIETAEKNGVELVLPVDIVVNKGFPAGDSSPSSRPRAMRSARRCSKRTRSTRSRATSKRPRRTASSSCSRSTSSSTRASRQGTHRSTRRSCPRTRSRPT